MRALSPHLDSPDHLAPFVESLEMAPGSEIELCIHAPPQHGKTEVIKHGFVQWAQDYPGLSHAYSTYNDDRTLEVLTDVKRLAFDAGLDPHTRKGLLTLSGGTQIKFTSIGGSLTGRPISGVHVIDDPVKDREDAESARKRERAWGWFNSVAQTRRHPGSSVIVMMTRWVKDDLVGRLIDRLGWRYIRLAALCDSEDDPLGREIDEALWPARRPAEFLRQLRIDAYTWASMYQGHPRPREAALFGEPTFYQRLPDHYRVGYGIDLAYTQSTRADFSVCVRLYSHDDMLYVTRVLRRQVHAPEFTLALKAEWSAERGPMLWYCSGTEKGAGQFVKQKVPALRIKQVTADKYIRATPAAESWNAGRIVVPANSNEHPWMNEFIEEMCAFSGQNDVTDDQVDGVAAGHDLLVGNQMRDALKAWKGQRR